MKSKKGVFFSTDALIALIIIFITMIAIFPMIKYSQNKYFIHEDIIKVLSSLKIGEIDDPYIKQLISEKKITDLNKSVLEQIGEFYVIDLNTAKALANSIISNITEDENVGIWYGNKLLASKNKTAFENAKYVEVDRRFISGIREGESVTGFSSRAYLKNSMSTKYFYFGGYVGEGNLSLELNYTGEIENVEIEVAVNRDFDVYINEIYSGHYQNSSSDFHPVEYNLGAYLGNFVPGKNIIKFSGEDLHISGGYVKMIYRDGDLLTEESKKYFFPGINGLINLYDGFYIPGLLESMKIYLHLNTPYNAFLKIGNTTIFRNNTKGETAILFENEFLSSKINYEGLTNKTIPLRLGLENVSYKGLEINIDSVLVNDVSGSMEWCSSSGETGYGTSIWTENNDVFCGDRRYLVSNCFPQKIYSAKNAEKAFVNAMLSNTGPRIGIVDYSGGNTVRKEPIDLSATLLIGPNPNCYEENWFEPSYDDSSWQNFYPYLYDYHIDNCDYCKSFFRKKFYVQNIFDIKYLTLNLYTDDGHLCYINGKEIGYSSSEGWRTYQIPKTVLKEGENLLACEVKDRTGYFRLVKPYLYTDKGYLVPENSPAVKYSSDPATVLHYSFDDYLNPAKDSSSYNNDGIIYGAKWQSDGSMYFDGNSYIRVPNSPSLQLNQNLTIEFWINPDGYLGYNRQNPIDKAYWGEFALTLESSSSEGGMSYYHGSGSYFSWWAFDPKTLRNQEWQHVVITRNANTRTVKSYLNGNLIKIQGYSSSYDPQKTNNDVYIGDGYAYGFRGWMDEIALYNRVLTEDEIQQHYSSASYTPNRWKKKITYQCGDSTNPKYIRARKNIQTNFTILADIFNSGPNITTPFKVKFYNETTSPANEISTITIDSMGTREHKTVRTNWQTTLNKNTKIYVSVDTDNAIAEGNEGNNQPYLWVYVYDYIQKDLDITSFSYSPTFCTWNPRTYTLTATVKNTGALNITEKFNLTFFKNSISPENIIGKTEINGLPADSSVSKSINWYADLSTNTIIYVRADYENIVVEGNEGNNDESTTIYKQLPDLRAYDISLNESLCSPNQPANRRLTFTIYNYNCPLENSTEAALSQTSGDLSNWQIIPSGTSTGYVYKYFDLSFTTPPIGTPKTFYSYVDQISKNISETNENNNNLSVSFSVGPNLYFYSSPSITPNPVQKNTPTNITITTTLRNTQCGPRTFNLNYYKNSISSSNLINSSRITLNDYNWYYHTIVWENANLNSNTPIYVVIDYDNEIAEYNENDNTVSNTIIVQDYIQASVFPTKFFSPLFLEMLGLASSCTGTPYNLFTPETSIVRVKNLTDNSNELYSFIDQTDSWWGTCICCGINKAKDLLMNSSSKNKFIVLMSDGEANIECPEQGTGSATEDAVQAACEAYNNYGIKVYSVGFGTEVEENTLRRIAQCGNGTYYYSNIEELVEIYRNIAEEIIETSYKEQTIKSIGNYSVTTLYPDSYIEFKYNETTPPYGLILNLEKKFFNDTDANFTLPYNSTIIEANIVSYSGPRWTSLVKINNISFYNLSFFGNEYTELGDPYRINIPNHLIKNENNITLRTALSPINLSEGSESNKIIYKINKNIVSYSPISSLAEGCLWNIDFDDGTNLTIKIPMNYTGESVCYYQENTKSYDYNDAIQVATYNLLKELDFNSNGRIDIKFLEQDLEISSSQIVGIPFSWSTEVQVRKWR